MTEPPVIPMMEKKPFPADRAMKLAMARQKALEVRRKNKEIRLQQELDSMKAKNAPKEEPVPEPIVESENVDVGAPEDIPVPDPVPEDEEPVPEPPPKVAPIKKKKNKKQMVVVEQSSDDSDEFEHNQNVVFVKRVRKKKEKAPDPPPVIERPSTEPPPVVRQPERPQLTPEQQQIHSYYNTMFNGNFLAAGRRR